jgi:hypothetical protein
MGKDAARTTERCGRCSGLRVAWTGGHDRFLQMCDRWQWDHLQLPVCVIVMLYVACFGVRKTDWDRLVMAMEACSGR